MRGFILPGAILAGLVLSTLAAGAEANRCKPMGPTKVVCRCTCTATDTSGNKITEKQDLTDTSPGACGINRGWACDITSGNRTVRGTYDDCAPAEVEAGKAGRLHGLTGRPDRVVQPSAGGKPGLRPGLRPGIVSPRATPSPSVSGRPGTPSQLVCCRLPSGHDFMARDACKKSRGIVVNSRLCR